MRDEKKMTNNEMVQGICASPQSKKLMNTLDFPIRDHQQFVDICIKVEDNSESYNNVVGQFNLLFLSST